MDQAIAFDTHRFVKRLTDCGFTERQAETLAEEQVSLLNSNLATKIETARIEAQIAKIQTEIAKIEAGMEAMRQEVKANLEAPQSGLLKWIIGAIIAQGGLIATLVVSLSD